MTDKLQRKFNTAFDRALVTHTRKNTFTGTLGNGDGDLYVYADDGSVREGFCWATVDFGDDVGMTERIVRCRRVTRALNTPVILGFGRDGQLEVIEEDAIVAEQFGGGYGFNVSEHAWTHGVYGPDQLMIDGRMLLPLQTRPTNPPSLSVYVEEYSYVYNGTEKFWPGGSIDLTGDLPTGANEHTLIIVCLNPATNTLVRVIGATTVPFLTSQFTIPFDGDDVALVDTGSYWRSAAVRVRADSTSLDWRDIFMDLKASAGGQASSYALDDLTDVAITSVARGDILTRNATQWVNNNVPEQRLVGRLTGGDVGPLTAAQTKTLLAIDHGADVTGLGDDDHTQYIIIAPLTLNRNLITAATATAYGLILKTSDDDPTYSLLELQTSAAAPIFAIRGSRANGGTTDQIEIALTAPTVPTVDVYGIHYTFTTAGAEAFNQDGLRIDIAAGLTSARRTSGLNVVNSALGTGATLNLSNQGGIFLAQGVGAGWNLGFHSRGDNSSAFNAGVVGRAGGAGATTAQNVGVAGYARNGTYNIGGYFRLSSSVTAVPSALSAALVANNDNLTSDIAVFQDNGTAVFTVADGGNVGSGVAANANTQVGIGKSVTNAASTTFALDANLTATITASNSIQYLGLRARTLISVASGHTLSSTQTAVQEGTIIAATNAGTLASVVSHVSLLTIAAGAAGTITSLVMQRNLYTWGANTLAIGTLVGSTINQVASGAVGGATITTLIGLDIEDQTAGGTTNLALRTGSGIVQFGDHVKIQADSKAQYWGTGDDCTIDYDGTNMRVKPDVVGTGYLLINTAQALAMVIGAGTAGIDYQLKFDGETNDGTITYMEDENRFDFNNAIGLGGKATVYNNVATEGYGIGAIVDDIALTGQTADIGSTNATNAGTAGTYRVSYYLETTTADVAAGTVTVTWAFTDAAGATTVASAAVSLAALGRTSGVFYVQLASGSVAYSTSHTGSYGTAAYALYASVERLS